MNTLLLTALTLLGAQVDVAAPIPTVVVHGASHHGDVAAQEIIWSSSLLARIEGDPALVRVKLARPLPKDVVVTLPGAGDVVERDERGRPSALIVPASAFRYGGTSPFGALGRLELRARQPLSTDGDVTLEPPLAEGDAVQRVVLSGATSLRFTADDALGIERRIGRSVGVDVSRDERRRLDRWFHEGPPMSGERLYLRVGPALVETGLRGELERAPAQRAGVGMAAALAFGLLLGVGGLVYRRAARQAELDRVEAILEEDYRGLA